MDLAQVFLTPRNANHRHYEALRAYFVDQLPAAEVARRFGYTVGSFHQLAHQFRHAPQRTFFAEPPRPGIKASESVRQQIVRLRKQNLSIYDISRALKLEGIKRTPVAVAQVLKQEGFARLPRRADDERPPAAVPANL
jgi:tRNA nucleotidyltransferase (CCA-adding enzyme)